LAIQPAAETILMAVARGTAKERYLTKALVVVTKLQKYYIRLLKITIKIC
jgi:hypothetical protein